MLDVFSSLYLNKKINKPHVRLCFDPSLTITIASNTGDNTLAIDTMLMREYSIRSANQMTETFHLTCFIGNIINPARVAQINGIIKIELDLRSTEPYVDVVSDVLDKHIGEGSEFPLCPVLFTFFKLVYLKILVPADVEKIDNKMCSLLDSSNPNASWWLRAVVKMTMFYRNMLRNRDKLHMYELEWSKVTLPRAESTLAYLGDLSKPNLELLPENFLNEIKPYMFTNTDKTVAHKLAPTIFSYGVVMGDCLLCVLTLKEGWFIYNDLSSVIEDEFIEMALLANNKQLSEQSVVEMTQNIINNFILGKGLTLVSGDEPTTVRVLEQKTAEVLQFKMPASVH